MVLLFFFHTTLFTGGSASEGQCRTARNPLPAFTNPFIGRTLARTENRKTSLSYITYIKKHQRALDYILKQL